MDDNYTDDWYGDIQRASDQNNAALASRTNGGATAWLDSLTRGAGQILTGAAALNASNKKTKPVNWTPILLIGGAVVALLVVVSLLRK